MRAETLGMAPCERCGQLSYVEHDELCDFTQDELDEVQEDLRDQAGRPDADHEEVCEMLDDPGVVVYVDPLELEDPHGSEE